MYMKHRETLCLVSPEIVAAERERSRATWLRGRITQLWWVTIEFELAEKGVKLRVFRHGEQDSGMWAFWERKFTWEDLDDVQFKAGLVAHEWEPVKSKVIEMLDALHESRLAMRRALSTTFAGASSTAAN